MYQFVVEFAIIWNYFTIHTISDIYNPIYMCLNSKFLKIEVVGEKLCGNGRTIVGNWSYFSSSSASAYTSFLVSLGAE